MSRKMFDLILRNDPKTFFYRTFQTVAPGQRCFRNWHINAMAYHLQLCLSGKIKRLIISLPPRSLKSICASVAFPAYLLGHDPSTRIICASYSADLAGKHARDCRATMEADWYRRLFPGTRISREKDSEMDFDTTRHGGRYSTSIGGTLTGRGGDFLIIDDPLKADDAFSEVKRSSVNDWFDGTLYSRLDNKREGVIIVVMQRHHPEDLVGHLLRRERWVHLNVPAIAEIDEQVSVGPGVYHPRKPGDLLQPDREPLEVLEGIKRTIGSMRFSAQYQQRPVPLEGELIKSTWFQQYDSVPPREPNDQVVQSWDTAYKAKELNDYSVCTTWLVQDNRLYLLDVLREKLLYPELKKKLRDHALSHRAEVIIIENKGSGIALIDELRQGGVADIPLPIAFEPEGDKRTRMATQAAKIEAGQVFLPRSAAWKEEFIGELLQFPYGHHDDQVDSLSQFLAWIQKRGSLFSWEFLDPWAAPYPSPSHCRVAPDAPPAAPVLQPRVLILTPSGALIPQADYAAHIAAREKKG